MPAEITASLLVGPLACELSSMSADWFDGPVDWPTATWSKRRLLFVYGTLKPGHSRWPILEPHLEPDAPVVDDAVDGRLWSTPWGWPALTDGSETVRGVRVELRSDRVAEALAELDAVEGVASALFERAEVVTRAGFSCWVYLWPNPTDGFEPVDGSW